MIAEEHLANIEREIHEMSIHGHLHEFELSVCVNAIEHQLFEARRLIENGRQHDRDCDIQEPDRGIVNQ